MSNPIYILIPVHNRRDTTLKGLRRLYADVTIQQWSELRVVVIDDGSSDGTAAALRVEFPTVIILSGDGNLWWTGAMHKGMEYAYRHGCEAVIWLNDDCPPRPGSLAKLHQVSHMQGNAIIGAACYTDEPYALIPTGAKGRTRVTAKPSDLLPVDEMSGHCVYIPRVVIDAIGFPDDNRFPHYHGDSSYILRATRAGFQAYLSGDAQVEHPGKIKAKLEDFIDFTNVLPRQTFGQLFLSRKSLYYWRTQYFYNTEKYGSVLGLSLFLIKSARWITQWARLAIALPKEPTL